MAQTEHDMTSLTRRLDRLEGTAGAHEAPACFVVTDYPGEPADAAVARYRAERPDTPEKARFIVVNTGIYRAPGNGLT
jgi:hypothetical protein